MRINTHKISVEIHKSVQMPQESYGGYYLFVFWRGSPPPPMGQIILIHEVSRSHTNAPHSVGLLWTSDQSVAETST